MKKSGSRRYGAEKIGKAARAFLAQAYATAPAKKIETGPSDKPEPESIFDLLDEK